MYHVDTGGAPWLANIFANLNKNRNDPNIISGTWAKTIHEKNQKQKISWYCPVNLFAPAAVQEKLGFATPWTWKIFCSSYIIFLLCAQHASRGIHFLKGQCHEIFCCWFFSWISFPPAPEYPIRIVSNFFENSRRYLQVKVHHRYQRHRQQNLPLISLELLIPVARCRQHRGQFATR